MTGDTSTTGMSATLMAGSMTDDSQTPTRAAILSAEILRPRNNMTIGCWNVRTMFQTGKLAQIAKEFESYNINILGISEARWMGTGKKKLTTGQTLLYSGRKDDQHQEGVALLMKKEVEQALIEWNPISERLISARFNSKFGKLTIINCYAPMEEAEEEE